MAWGAGAGVRRVIDEQYLVVQRASSLRWMAVNAVLLLTFSLDLWYACPGYHSALHYVEGALACAAAASAARHAARLLRAVPSALPPASAPAPPPAPTDLSPPAPADLSPALRWRRESPPSPPEPAAPMPRTPPDALISDRAHLDRYLTAVQEPTAAWSECGASSSSPPPYQVSPLRSEPAPLCVRSGGAAGEPWRRVHVEPARLARFDLDLRRWLHATVLGRLARELDAADAEMAAAGLEARAGAASVARLEALAAAAPGSLGARLRGLLPFLRPFSEQEYVVARVRALARSPCLAGYRWDGGGAGWDGARHPADAELLVRLLAAYLDGVVPGGGGAFSAAHVQWSGAPVRGPGVLALHAASARPPHYAVVLGAEVLEPAGGRCNLPAALLLFLAAAARRDPPALLRLHLGPAGLNMLWMLEP